MSTDIGPLPSPRAVAQVAQDYNLLGTNAALTQFNRGNSTFLPSIDLTRWNKLYPYCLILARASTEKDLHGGADTTAYQEIARFTLPIAPEQLQIQAPPAIIVTKTLGGVVEEHNGIPFKNIILQGTTGVLPLRSSVIAIGDNGVWGGLLAGTLQAVNQTRDIVSSAVGQVNADFFGGTQPSNREASQTPKELQGTGYAQFRLLRRFLEGYANAKKVGNSDLRLLFAIFKDEVAYVVTPMAFNLRRDVSSPLRYRYDIQLKAWHEVPSNSLSGPIAGNWSVTEVRSTMTKVLDTILAAQRVILSAVSIVNAVRADIQKVLNIVRQVILAVKLVVGVVVAIIDLPRKILEDLEEVVFSSWAMLKDSIYGSGPDSIAGALAAYTTTQQSGAFKGRPYLTPPSRPLTNQTGVERPPSPLDGIFANPYTKASNDFLSIIMLDKLEIPDAIQARIDVEFERVSKFRPADFARMRDTVVEAAVSISDTVGASDSQFNSTYNNPTNPTTRTPNLEDFSILFAINDIVGVLNELAAEPDVATNSTMDYVAGIAGRSGIAFQTAASKYGVPFPYDTTLEQVSARYLKDPDRWMEIAILNGLREPYIDEVGFDVSLIANGNLSEIVIADATNLKIGQPVWIQSTFVVREKRHILNINEVSQGNVVLTLDGAADLDRYVVAAHAYIHAFLPDTVNSQQLIYIPSDIPIEDNSELAKIPGIDAFDDLLEVGGVDMLLTTQNDLAVTNDGDCRLAYGMSALVQRAKIALGTPQGTLLRHPTYGLPVKVGQSIADLDINALAIACKQVFAADPAFDGVSTVSIAAQGPVVAINLGLYVKGQDLPISLAIEVKR
jgi:hypothetical protein